MKYETPLEFDGEEDQHQTPFDWIMDHVMTGLAFIGGFSIFVAVCFLAGYMSR